VGVAAAVAVVVVVVAGARFDRTLTSPNALGSIAPIYDYCAIASSEEQAAGYSIELFGGGETLDVFCSGVLGDRSEEWGKVEAIVL
jgi:hypothetical protein